MSDVPPEVQKLHLDLFKNYVEVLISKLRVTTDGAFWEDTTRRIERLLALDGGVPGRAEYVYLTSHDYDALDEFRAMTRDIIGDPTTTEEFLEEGPSDGDHHERPDNDSRRGAEEPDAEVVLQEVPSDDERGTAGDADAGMVGDTDVGLPELQPAVGVGPTPADDIKRPAYLYRNGPDDNGIRVVGTLGVDEKREVRAAKQRGFSEETIDATWELHPDKTRATVARMLRGGLLTPPDPPAIGEERAPYGEAVAR